MVKDILIILATFIVSYFFFVGLIYGLFKLLFIEETENEMSLEKEIARKKIVLRNKQAQYRRNRPYVFNTSTNHVLNS